jgi:hypothetical protein
MLRTSGFSKINGRDVYTDAVSKRWRCPECKWWRDWSQDHCCACGYMRDAANPEAQEFEARKAGA